jgi:hypothetical protein
VKPAERAVARQWLSSRHVKAATDTQAKTKELLEAVFSMRSVPRLYNEDQLPLSVRQSREFIESVEGVSVGRQLRVSQADS